MGNVYLTIHERTKKKLPDGYPDYLEKAKDAFKCSLAIQPEQQRASYNLARIMAEYEHKYDEAAGLLKDARHHPNWQRAATPPDLTAYFDYNRGCYLAKSIATKISGCNLASKREAREALDYIEAGLQTQRILWKDITTDYDDPNDSFIWALYQKADDELKTALDAMRPVVG